METFREASLSQLEQKPSRSPNCSVSPPPRDIEQWLNRYAEGTKEWPVKECSTSLTLLDEETCNNTHIEEDLFLSFKAIKSDLEKHSPWDSTFLDALDIRLQRLEEKLNWFADRFICDGHPLTSERDRSESVAGGLKNITNMTFLTELCDMDLLNSRQLTSTFKEKTSYPIVEFTRTDDKNVKSSPMKLAVEFTKTNDKNVKSSPRKSAAESDNKNVKSSARKSVVEFDDKNVKSSPMKAAVEFTKTDDKNVKLGLQFPGLGLVKSLALPAKVEPLPILDLVTKAQISSNLLKTWKKVFFTDATTSLLINSFWWIWMDYFKPDQLIQASLFDIICENFVALLNCIENRHKDAMLMHYPDCLSQAVYSTFCHACPGSNKLINSEQFLDYLTNLISEWMTGIKVGPGCWRRWPRYLLDPYHTSTDRPLSGAPGLNSPFTEKDVMSLSITHQLSWQQFRPSFENQGSGVQFNEAKSDGQEPRQLMMSVSPETLGSTPGGSPSRTIRALSGRNKNRHSLTAGQDKQSTTHIGPGPIFECVRFSILGQSPLLHHYLVCHNLLEDKAPSGPTISRRQVKKVPRPSIGYKEFMRKSQEASERQYAKYKREMARSTQESFNLQKHHAAELRKLEKQNKRTLSHRHEVAILAETLLAKRRQQSAGVKRIKTPAQEEQ